MAANGVDAVVVGAGPNGLAAAIHLARADRSVLVLEASGVGGGCRSASFTRPGFVHDVCSAVHPFAAASPFLRELGLEGNGYELIQPPVPLAHPLDDGTAVALLPATADTADGLGTDGKAYRRLMDRFVDRFDDLMDDVLTGVHAPRHPILLGRFGLHAVRSAKALAEGTFDEPRARALVAGLASHSMLPLDAPFTAAFALILAAAAHAVGWPVARGGSQRIVDAMAGELRSLGGEIRTGVQVRSMDELPEAGAYLFDTSPSGMAEIAGDRLPEGYRAKLGGFRRGPGAFKLDLAIDGPIPWTAEECRCAGTVHLGGTFEEIAEAERAVADGEHPERPFVLLAQQSLFDDSRAPEGKHTVWAYCHVPNGSDVDMTDSVEAQIERFAPGFRDLVTTRHVMGPAALERYNANYVGGDISGGGHGGVQLFARPVASVTPHATPAEGIYLCSSSTPPGAGVHGMCGFLAAEAALRKLR